MLVRLPLNESAIKAQARIADTSEVRCTRHPHLKLRFHKSRTSGTWLVWSNAQWNVIGHWPQISLQRIVQGLPDIALRLAVSSNDIAINQFETVADLLTWYVTRCQADGHLSQTRKSTIESSVRLHICPKLGFTRIDMLTKSILDKKLIWPLQQTLSMGTVIKYFNILKAAFSQAHKLEYININPLSNIAIKDFGRFKQLPRAARLQPVMLPEILASLTKAPVPTRVLMLMQLVFGTRVGETRQAKWRDLTLTDDGVWHIPANHTKTGQSHQLPIPAPMVAFLQHYQHWLNERGELSVYLLPSANGSGPMTHDDASYRYKVFSEGMFSSHDVRKCARSCWAEQGVDFLVAERLLNHSLGKVAETYIDTQVRQWQRQAIVNHAKWLVACHAHCFAWPCN
ncbi:hypothetical protein FE810_15405 [Thalassotalea litorea]|uniref:Tyr recombinase domain-containing protein n=1 Tax=Thalassotalea litorea TaxID=2020715 RepID=A0A5R9IGD9_9GAMM|nr:tyrosine-type recombinase/integrase [Thalassotalea litorea]TLU61208.1 hypothetical protein FE810_15405 [Thalassotalea litorea]